MSPYFDDSDIEKVRQATDIAELIGGYVTLKRKGAADLWGRCPFHSEKSASFHVRSDRGMFHCFGCGKGGNAVTFLMEIERLTFQEAVKFLAERAGIPLTVVAGRDGGAGGQERERLFHACGLAARWFHERLTSTPRSHEAQGAFEYLAGRGIGLEIIRRFQIGFAEAGWDALVSFAARSGVGGDSLFHAGLASQRRDGSGFVDRFRARVVFPIVSLSGKPVAFGARRIEGITPAEDDAKYVNSAETAIYHKGEHLYGLLAARDDIRRAGMAYLVEGYIDLTALVQAGVLNGVASLGTALTEAQARLLGRFAGRVCVVYDGDAAGVTAAIRAADVLTLAGLEVRMAMLAAGDDPDSLLHRDGREALLEALRQERSFVQFRLDAAGADRRLGQAELLTAVRGVIETIRAVGDPLQRELLLEELAARTGLRRDAIERAAAGAARISPEVAFVKSGLAVTPDQVAERDLLKALLGHPELIPEAMERVAADQFENPLLKALYLSLEQAFFSGAAPDIRALPDYVADPAQKAFIADAALAGGSITLEDARTALLDCVRQFERRTLMRKRESLEQDIRSAENGTSARHLLGRLAELNRQLNALQSS